MTYDLWAEVEEVGRCLLHVRNDLKNGAKMSNLLHNEILINPLIHCSQNHRKVWFVRDLKAHRILTPLL